MKTKTQTMNTKQTVVTDSGKAPSVELQLAQAFVRQLRDNISFGEFVKVRKLNATPEYGDGVCASHDFIDANEVMNSAFNEITGRDVDGENESDCVLWSKAWDIAKREYLTEKD